MLQGQAGVGTIARRLRKQMTLPEVLLWRVLKARPAGLKFRRQHPAGAFVLDFYCHEARLVVEVDGKVHDMGDGPEHDRERDTRLRALGLKVLRIPATDVLRSPEEIGAAIADYARDTVC